MECKQFEWINELQNGVETIENRRAILEDFRNAFSRVWPGIQGANLVHHNIFPTIRQSRSEPSVTDS